MKIYIVRHGDSLESDIDSQRPLSNKGKADIERLGRYLANLNLNLAQIIHSGILRAEETAGILAKMLEPDILVKPHPSLKSLDDPSDVILEIETVCSDILIVSHLPFVDRFTSKLLTGDENKSMIPFEPGTLVCLERNKARQWIINFILQPFLFFPIVQR
jgi:phosphohistidine phosphatase